MKKVIGISAVVVLSASLVVSFNSKDKVEPAKAIVIATDGCKYLTDGKIATEIDLNAVSDTDIRGYYASLNTLPESELKGTNLLKNLKPILYEMNYYTYDAIWKIYEITDRDWDLSKPQDDSYATYDSVTNMYTNYQYGSTSNKKNNPYVHTLYREPGIEHARIREWDSHNNDGTNREHVWCQSRGFKAPTGAEGPAGTDLHHLKSGDGYVNTLVHNNSPYGFVATVSKTGDKTYTNQNLLGTALHTFPEDEASKVFEPQDSDKGDIARAVFYMAARYNNWSGHESISQYEPNLIMANYATSDGDHEDSSATHPVAMGILQDLLVWNKLDPVDEYERHRNDLIYRNYQGNRNPFIDFPQWADAIWGTATMDSYDSTPKGKANPQTDVINDAALIVSDHSIELNVNETAKVTATTLDSSDITWQNKNPGVISLDKNPSHSGEEVTFTALAGGTATVKVKATVGGQAYEQTIYFTVKAEEAKPKMNLIIIIGIGVGAVVFVTLAIVVFVNSSKKTRKKMISAAKSAVKYTTSSGGSTKKKSSSSSSNKKKK